MAKQIKRFFVFLAFSLFFALLSGRLENGGTGKGKTVVKGAKSLNSAMAAMCCENGIGENEKGRYCL